MARGFFPDARKRLARCGRPLEAPLAALGHPAGGGQSRPRRGVDLAFVVHLNDLGVIEEASGDLRKVGHHDGAQSEIGRDYSAKLTFETLAIKLIEERFG